MVLTEGSYNSEVITLTEIGIKIVSPPGEGMKEIAMKEAFLKPRVIKAFLEKYSNAKLPQEKIAMNVLEEIGLPKDSTQDAYELILEGAKELGLVRESKGNFWVDLDGVPLNSRVDIDDEGSSITQKVTVNHKCKKKMMKKQKRI